MGGQTILVPPEVNLEVQGRRRDGRLRPRANGQGTPGAPHVMVRGFSLWGSVGIRRKHRRHNG